MIDLLFSQPLYLIVFVVSLLIALTVHEFAHAWVADYLGDPTARLQGRISLNPLVHLDPIGTLFMAFFGFGWGKPVQFDPFNLQNPRKDAALISLAGPASNIIVSIILSIVLRSFIFFNLPYVTAIGLIISIFITTNLSLGLFNLIPVHPLDGFKIMGGILSRKQAMEWYQLERYGMLFLILLIIPIGNTSMLDAIVGPLMRIVVPLFVPGGLMQGTV